MCFHVYMLNFVTPTCMSADDSTFEMLGSVIESVHSSLYAKFSIVLEGHSKTKPARVGCQPIFFTVSARFRYFFNRSNASKRPQ